MIAPFDGIVDVDDKKQDAPSITLYSHEKQVSASVSEYDYEKLSQGQKVEVKALATKKTQESTIAFLSQVPGEGKSTGYPLTIDVDGNNFMDGQTVKVSVPLGFGKNAGNRNSFGSRGETKRYFDSVSS